MAVKNAPTGPEFKAPNDDNQAPIDQAPDVEPKNTPADVNPDVNPDDYAFVTFPDGSLHAVKRSDVDRANRNANLPDSPARREADNANEEVYIHLANGTVERVRRGDLPEGAGHGAAHGYYITDGHAHYVTGVYPVETKHTDA